MLDNLDMEIEPSSSKNDPAQPDKLTREFHIVEELRSIHGELDEGIDIEIKEGQGHLADQYLISESDAEE